MCAGLLGYAENTFGLFFPPTHCRNNVHCSCSIFDFVAFCQQQAFEDKAEYGRICIKACFKPSQLLEDHTTAKDNNKCILCQNNGANKSGNFFRISLFPWKRWRFVLAFSLKFNLGCVFVFSKNHRITHKFMYSFGWYSRSHSISFYFKAVITTDNLLPYKLHCKLFRFLFCLNIKHFLYNYEHLCSERVNITPKRIHTKMSTP